MTWTEERCHLNCVSAAWDLQVPRSKHFVPRLPGSALQAFLYSALVREESLWLELFLTSLPKFQI